MQGPEKLTDIELLAEPDVLAPSLLMVDLASNSEVVKLATVWTQRTKESVRSAIVTSIKPPK